MNNDTWSALGSLGQLLSAIFMIIGFFFIIWQIRATNKVASADFILRLESEFIDHHFRTYQKLLPNGAWAGNKKGPLMSLELAEIEHYLDFFANLQVLRTEGLISLETIDKMFAYRFFISTNNPHTRRIVKPKREYWDFLFTLYSDWKEYRRKMHRIIPNENYSLLD